MVHRISFVAIRVAPSHSQIPFPYTALIETTCTCRWCNFPANLFCHLHYSSYRAFLVLVWYKSYSLPSLIHIKREKKWFLALRVLFSKKSIASSSIPSLQRSYRFTLHPPLYASSQNEREKRNREHPRATIATWSTSRRSDGFRFPQDRRNPPPPPPRSIVNSFSLSVFLSLSHTSRTLFIPGTRISPSPSLTTRLIVLPRSISSTQTLPHSYILAILFSSIRQFHRCSLSSRPPSPFYLFVDARVPFDVSRFPLPTFPYGIFLTGPGFSVPGIHPGISARNGYRSLGMGAAREEDRYRVELMVGCFYWCFCLDVE